MRVTSVSSPERCTTAGVTNVPSSRSRGGTVAENVMRRSNRVPSGFRRKAWNTPSLFFVPEDPPLTDGRAHAARQCKAVGQRALRLDAAWDKCEAVPEDPESLKNSQLSADSQHESPDRPSQAAPDFTREGQTPGNRGAQSHGSTACTRGLGQPGCRRCRRLALLVSRGGFFALLRHDRRAGIHM